MVLLVLFVGCLAIITRGGDSSKETADGEKKGTSKNEAEAVSIGQPVTVGDVVWTVTDARRESQLFQEGVSPQFAKTAEGTYVIVDFDFTNNGNEAVTLNTESLKLIDSEGRESGASPEQVFYVPEDRKIFLERVNPGVTQQGQAIFEVAPGASNFRVEAGDTNMFTNESGYIDLGF